ncbi:hypothetical protein [Burkholderia sp. BE17]|uniref:hypothetical protein n=1 Tax=Burkholderia sp. BE17 TaxID=2656644 RepID=UPI00187B6105|nr:hypothetical protein [Burkholderia sp. BE17]
MPHAVETGVQFATGPHPLAGRDAMQPTPGEDPAADDAPRHASATAIAARHRARSPS